MHISGFSYLNEKVILHLPCTLPFLTSPSQTAQSCSPLQQLWNQSCQVPGGGGRQCELRDPGGTQDTIPVIRDDAECCSSPDPIF